MNKNNKGPDWRKNKHKKVLEKVKKLPLWKQYNNFKKLKIRKALNYCLMLKHNLLHKKQISNNKQF